MKKIIMLFVVTGFLASCSTTHEPLKAPCPDFGADCTQQNVNSWNN